jgi:phenylpropionate dioxygenase-like ring-hydroxylating dioxygenase large terminal subunit
MSDLATAGRLRQASTQFPVSWYCDPRVLEVEQQLLLARGPGYVGHEFMVPNVGDFQALAARGEAQLLVRNANGVELLSNICRHRQALMYNGRGNTRNIVCPLHRWTYDLKGELLGAPHFPDKPCLNLGRTPMQHWNGLLFDGPRNVAQDLAALGVKHFDFSGYMLDRVEMHQCNYNWKSFIEVYLEDYHVGPFHPGLGQFVTCDDLKWEFGDWYSVQTVGINNSLSKPGSRTYERWHKAVLDFYRGEIPQHGAVWLTYYPNIMLEWYPHVLVISTLIPQGVDKTMNVVEFYYPRRSRCSSVNSSRPNRPRTWRRPGKTMRSPNGWMRGGSRCTGPAGARSVPISRRWKTACSTSTNSTAVKWKRTSRTL